MSYDLFQSKRGYNTICKWWSVDNGENIRDNELVHTRQPNGIFWVKEVASENNEPQVLNGQFQFEENTITLKTPDNLFGIKKNDIVLYDGEIWRINSIQREKIRKQQGEYVSNKFISCFWYLSLRS